MEAIKRYNLADQVYDFILNSIISNTYYPGERLSENKIGTDTGIGRTPIREALLKLNQEHLIHTIPQSGTYVSMLNIDDALDARYIRSSIEQRIMYEAAHNFNISPSQIAEVNAVIEKEKVDHKQKNDVALALDDNEFHKVFYRLTDHQRIWDWLRMANIQLTRFRVLRFRLHQQSWSAVIKEHQNILKAVINKDTTKLEQLTITHVRWLVHEQDELINAYPDYFVKS